MKIWIHVDDVQLGPFDISELPLDRMTAETPVWYEGLSYWVPAGKAPKTAHLFAPQQQSPSAAMGDFSSNATQRPSQQASDSEAPTKCPPSYLIWSILLTVLCCNPIGIIPIIIGATVGSKFNNYNFDGARRASECTAWWLMITIVTSLILVPFSVIPALM